MKYDLRPTNEPRVDMYYNNPRAIDLAKMREDAARAARGDYREAPRPATIHFHGAGDPCDGNEHEEYPASKEASADGEDSGL